MRARALIIAELLLAFAASAQQPGGSAPSPPSPTTRGTDTDSQPSFHAPVPSRKVEASSLDTPTPVAWVLDRIIEREHQLLEMLKTRTPLVETYLQDLQFSPQTGAIPVQDHYFFGRMDFRSEVDRRDYLVPNSFKTRVLGGFDKLYKFEYRPLGFSWMIFPDRNDFNRQTYSFQYADREFLGEVRCLVFDVSPKKGTGRGRFHGRIWVEDHDYSIVRFNGIFGPNTSTTYFFHMDSWRLNVVRGYWLPAYVYSEEGDFSYGSKARLAFKAQTRLWGYNLQKASKEGEFTEVLVDPVIKDASPTGQDASPLQAQRDWMQHAEENVIERLQNAGLLAPKGEPDNVLETVLENLLITNKIDLQRPIHARVMLTTPIESFSVGNTIVVSRGLLDVLPDEASLAMVLAHELAHVVLGHNLGSKYAFSDRMLFSDESVYRNLGFRHSPEEEAAADKKAIDLLKDSPYNQKLASAGLFLRQVSERASALSALLTPHLGNGFMRDKGKGIRMASLMQTAPRLDPNQLDQVAALPLGGRVKLDPWDNRVELMKTAPVVITSRRDKMPLEVTPFSPRMIRHDAIPASTASAVEPKD